jgi:Transposase DDE domain
LVLCLRRRKANVPATIHHEKRIKPAYLAADTAYGSAETLNWLVNDKKIEPHIPVIDKSRREDGTFSRADFAFDKERNVYVCPNNKLLHTTGTVHDGYALRYRASKADCDVCAFKMRCCPSTPMRYVPRDLHEDARDVARALAKTEAFEQSRRSRKRVEMLFAHLKRILRLGRLRLRGPRGDARSRCAEPSPTRKTGRSTATTSLRMSCVAGSQPSGDRSRSPKRG